MDEYLESLVKKCEAAAAVATEEAATEEAAEEVAVEEEVVEQLTVIPEEDEQESEAANQVEEPVTEAATKKVETVIFHELIGTPGKAKEQVKEASKKSEKKKVSHADIPELEVNKEYDVKDARVFKSPDLKQISQLISGRVIYLGQVGDFAIVKYMRHGFGLVQGYIRDIEKSLIQ